MGDIEMSHWGGDDEDGKTLMSKLQGGKPHRQRNWQSNEAKAWSQKGRSLVDLFMDIIRWFLSD